MVADVEGLGVVIIIAAIVLVLGIVLLILRGADSASRR